MQKEEIEEANWFGKGAVIGIFSTFPLAAFCALFYKFPFPFGYVSGAKGFFLSQLSVLFYFLLGGFIVQAILGGIGSLIACKIFQENLKKLNYWRKIYSVIGALIGVLFITLSDKIFGPW